LLGPIFLWAVVVGNPSRAVTLAENRTIDPVLQIFNKLAEPDLRDKISRGLKLALDVFEDNGVTESSRSTTEAGIGFAKTMIALDQISNVIPLQQIAPNRTLRICGRPLRPSAAMDLIDGSRTSLDRAGNPVLRDGDICALRDRGLIGIYGIVASHYFIPAEPGISLITNARSFLKILSDSGES
jgi:hypothetical protein